MSNRYTKANAITNIRDYYLPAPHEVVLGKQAEVFERAKGEYIRALKAQIETAEKITFVDVFPKACAGVAA